MHIYYVLFPYPLTTRINWENTFNNSLNGYPERISQWLEQYNDPFYLSPHFIFILASCDFPKNMRNNKYLSTRTISMLAWETIVIIENNLPSTLSHETSNNIRIRRLYFFVRYKRKRKRKGQIPREAFYLCYTRRNAQRYKFVSQTRPRSSRISVFLAPSEETENPLIMRRLLGQASLGMHMRYSVNQAGRRRRRGSSSHRHY